MAKPLNAAQLSLFDQVAQSFVTSPGGVLDNKGLYRKVAGLAGVSEGRLDEKVPVGRSGQRHSIFKRQVRWHQQSLKHLGLIVRVDSVRGLWRLTEEGKHRLRRAEEGVALLAFSTDLGIAIFSSCKTVFSRFNEPIHLVITSPPYPLRKPRAYGNPPESEYIDFICGALEPVVANLCPGGSLCLNLSQDIFQSGSPARSLYLERLTLALNENLGLFLMDRLIWANLSKPPGPVQWASINRFQLNVAYEPVLWMTNDPHRVRSDNRRVLERHSERQLRLIAKGGETRTGSYSDGAYTIREGSYGNATEGRIPRNVLSIGHACPDSKECRRDAGELGLPVHGAPMPIALADFLIRFLSTPGDLVVDPFGGTLTTARAAECLGRRWCSTELILEYIRAAAQRFSSDPGFWLNPAIYDLASLH